MREPEPGARPIRSAFMRGGTSKGLVFLKDDLPSDDSICDAIFLAAMGSPDPYGRQLNGMGGGLSSLSKICIVAASSRQDADVDYTFGQVLISQSRIDYSGNCGNMSAAIGPLCLMRGLIPPVSGPSASIIIHNTNTGKRIRSTFPADGATPRFSGDFSIDGVAGTAAPIRLDFLDPGGSATSRLLPTGQRMEKIDVNGRNLRVTLIDAATPCIFIDARDLGIEHPPLPQVIDEDEGLKTTLEHVRIEASLRMGIATSKDGAATKQSIPKVALIFPPQDHHGLSDRKLAISDMSVVVRMMSMGQAHKALPITGAICLAAALRLSGSVPERLARETGRSMLIAHPSGLITVDAIMEESIQPRLIEATVMRTARCLFDGFVYY